MEMRADFFLLKSLIRLKKVLKLIYGFLRFSVIAPYCFLLRSAKLQSRLTWCLQTDESIFIFSLAKQAEFLFFEGFFFDSNFSLQPLKKYWKLSDLVKNKMGTICHLCTVSAHEHVFFCVSRVFDWKSDFSISWNWDRQTHRCMFCSPSISCTRGWRIVCKWRPATCTDCVNECRIRRCTEHNVHPLSQSLSESVANKRESRNDATRLSAS